MKDWTLLCLPHTMFSDNLQAPSRSFQHQQSQPDRIREIPVIHESAGRTQSAPAQHIYNATQPNVTQIPIQRVGVRGGTPPQAETGGSPRTQYGGVPQHGGIPQHMRSEGWQRQSPPSPRSGSPARSIPIRVESSGPTTHQFAANEDNGRQIPVHQDRSNQQELGMSSQQEVNNHQTTTNTLESPGQSSPRVTRTSPANTHGASPSRQSGPDVTAEQPRASPVPSHLRTESPTPQRAASPALAKMTPIEQINTIQQESDQLQAKLNGFKSAKGSKEYRYLEEMLTRLLIKLDGIESEGKDEIRQARKKAIRSVQAGLDHLELIGMANEVSDEASTQQEGTPMETDNTTPTPPSEKQSESSRESQPQSAKDAVADGQVKC